MTRPPPHPLDALVAQLASHRPLDDGDREAILALPYRLRSLEAQSYIVREGDRAETCAVLVTGFAFRHKVTGEGTRQIMSVNIPGDALDFQNLFLAESDHNVQALTRVQVAEVAQHAMEALAFSRGGVGRAILVSTLVEAATFREWTMNIGRRDSRQRILHLLCEFAYRLSAQGGALPENCALPMTQEQLADATGLTPVHVNRVLKGLEADGLIARERRIMRLPDWKRLREAADFNPRYLHLLAPGGPPS